MSSPRACVSALPSMMSAWPPGGGGSPPAMRRSVLPSCSFTDARASASASSSRPLSSRALTCNIYHVGPCDLYRNDKGPAAESKRKAAEEEALHGCSFVDVHTRISQARGFYWPPAQSPIGAFTACAHVRCLYMACRPPSNVIAFSSRPWYACMVAVLHSHC